MFYFKRYVYLDEIIETRVLHKEPVKVILDICKDGVMLSYNEIVTYRIKMNDSSLLLYEGNEIICLLKDDSMQKYARLSEPELQIIDALIAVYKKEFFGKNK